MPIGTSEAGMTSSLYTPEIKQQLTEQIGELIPVEHRVSDGPAERFRFEGAVGEVGFISAMSHHFCHTCNRLRLTASGQLRSCLLSDHQQDLKTLLRSGASDDALSAVFFNAARMKGAQHGLACDTTERVSGQMSSIGG
jgi:cyclic pyranopterin phosphate synthase